MSNPLDFTHRETVLLVDDSPDVLTTIAGLLRDEYETKIANGGEVGLRLASTHPLPDLVLLDVEMPEMDGYEICRRLKADPARALTEIRQALQAGATPNGRPAAQ